LIRSMTAYGRAEHALGKTPFVVEIRSVNNRYRDIVLRLPKNVQVLEEALRGAVASRIRRGRIEVSLQMERNGEAGDYELELNVPLVRSYARIFEQLREEFGFEERVSADSLCQMKDVILTRSAVLDVEEMKPPILEALGRALDSHDRMRINEGKAIESDFRKRLGRMDLYLDTIVSKRPQVVEEYSTRLKERIARMLEEGPVDEGRLAQEVAFFVDRSDISEECVRIRSHLSQFEAFLSMEEALGRRLDFLIQEIHREVNTLSSKAADSEISTIAVEMKAELEKLREQAQNVE
jgi:uncharacterized protein (TIGR00255 family)